MKAGNAAARGGNAGFALIEAIAAIVLLGVILSSLAIITSQWLPAWRKTYDRTQHSEALAIALDRVADDIAAAQFIRVGGDLRSVMFEGSERSVVLVRSAIGPNSERGLETVRIGEATDRRGAMVARSRVAFVPGVMEVDPDAGRVALLRHPYWLSFSFAGEDLIWRPAWQNEESLPAMVQVVVRDASGRQGLARVVSVRAQRPAPENCAENGCRPDQTSDSSQADGEPLTREQITAGLSR
ncbi:general secretion pathway protein GspJ [Bradyrhizobium sp. INPA01-394B]|uniref:General secretion pathway protein GspJ n=1 Tax=Bradyrhizobium campsiandrae TaxID=1729892 RepID=A0ABR7UB88_9BRAD|nr:general secretion pathway protein GspJ [Bradyrhizobium campsiandrae]MBC9879621.1 general secretion pathway protein GspJ [Bradyrhizobium campsiandrae]MBC9980774.1 general secretion pathway protein GspJ [Bradyrhizobium campsiandrae]